MLAKKLKIEEVRQKLKEILIDTNEKDPRVRVQVFEREALHDVFRDVYRRGVVEGRDAERRILKNKLEKIYG